MIAARWRAGALAGGLNSLTNHPKWRTFLGLLLPWLRRWWVWLAVPSAGVLLAGQFVSVGANLSPSLPHTGFLVLKYDKQLQRGDLAVFSPRRSAFYSYDIPMAKIVAGVAGDTIEIQGNQVFINGKLMGTAKTHSTRGPHAGQAMPHIVQGVIPAGHFFMYAPHVDSLDSRYEAVGLVTQDRIIGRALGLF
jgi:conjugative transfer signal peptidase TraF